MRLAEQQRAFWQAVRTRGAPPPRLEDWLTSSARQSATERLAVYHVAYWQRQVTALSATFPRTVALLGSERLLLSYIEQQPGAHPCIEQLGRAFATFLEGRQVDPEVLGVARLEWAETESLLAPDEPALAALPRDLGAAFVEQRLTFSPSLHVERVPVSSLAVFSPELVPDRDATAQVVVAFFRPHHAVLHVVLEPDEARAVALAQGGGMVALICAAFSELPAEQAPQRALQVLGQWFARGWVTSCNR